MGGVKAGGIPSLGVQGGVHGVVELSGFLGTCDNASAALGASSFFWAS